MTNPAGILAAIRGLCRAGRIGYTRHAQEQMQARGFKEYDVEWALARATSCVWQDRRRTWRVGCCTRRDERLTVIVALEDDVIVVTVFEDDFR